jgi:hypothetical protein
MPIIEVTPTITAGAYTAAYVIGGPMSFALPSISDGKETREGFIYRLIITDAANIKAAMRIWLYKTTITTIADNSAFSVLSDADNAKCIGWIDVATTDYITAGANAVAPADVKKGIQTVGSNLTAVAVVTATPTYTSTTDLVFKIEYWAGPS